MVVIPTHQRRESLARVLDALTRQRCPAGAFSVVVVCDGCTDGTQATIRDREFPFELTLLENDVAAGPGASRNRAIESTAAPIVVFLDDDVIPREDLIETHAEHHKRDDKLVVIGPLIPPARIGQPWIRWEADTLLRQYREMEEGAWAPTPRQFYTGNASVRREHVVAVGGFNAGYSRGEDVDLAFRLQRHGLSFMFEPRAIATHLARRTFRSWLNAAREYGRVELSMGPVFGDRGLVDVKVIEFQRRNPVVQRTVLWGLRHPRVAPAVLAALGLIARSLSAVRAWKLARGAYTAIFELAYWRGVEDAGGGSRSPLQSISEGLERLRSERVGATLRR